MKKLKVNSLTKCKVCNKNTEVFLKHDYVGLVASCFSCAEKAFKEDGEDFIYEKKNKRDIPVVYLKDRIIDGLFGTESHKRKVEMIKHQKKLNLSKNLIDNPEGYLCKCCEEKIKNKIEEIEKDLEKSTALY